jgi:hypothetical protein
MNSDQGRTAAPGAAASAKLARLVAMASSMAAELRGLELNQDARARMLRMHRQLIDELATLLRPELSTELTTLRIRVDDQAAPPTTAELRIAHAQLKGWLESIMADPGRYLNADSPSFDRPVTPGRRPTDAHGGPDRDAAAASSEDHRRAAQDRGTRAPGARTRTF